MSNFTHYAIITLCLLTLAMSAKATVDVNLSELEYVSDHLTPDECRRLVAALHSRSYKLNPQFPDSVRKVPRDVSCLNMLVHWNSRLGEGRGQTHSILSRRLKQIDRKDLATWLSQTSFHQLAEDLGNTLLKEIRDEPEIDDTIRQPRATNDSCADSTNVTESTATACNETSANETDSKSGMSFWDMLSDTTDENYLWNLMDLIGFVLLVFVAFAVIGAVVWCLLVQGCPGQQEKDVEGCNCDHGSTETGGPKDSNGAGKQPATKRDKKKKKGQRSLKSMVCKTVEYHMDGTVEEVQLLLDEASETDFERAVGIVAGKQPEVDLDQEPPPPPRDSKRRRLREAGQRREGDESLRDHRRGPETLAGGSDSFEMQEMHGEGHRYNDRGASDQRERAYDERSRPNDDRGYHNEERRWSDDRRGDPPRDPCWDCNQ